MALPEDFPQHRAQQVGWAAGRWPQSDGCTARDLAPRGETFLSFPRTRLTRNNPVKPAEPHTPEKRGSEQGDDGRHGPGRHGLISARQLQDCYRGGGADQRHGQSPESRAAVARAPSPSPSRTVNAATRLHRLSGQGVTAPICSPQIPASKPEASVPGL